MKVLQINSVCGTGSTGRIATDLYKMLEQNGHECCIAYGRGSAPEGFHTIRIGRDFDVYCHGVLSRITDRHGFYSKYATKIFLRNVKEYDPDIIHLHNIHGYYINIELLFEYLKESGKPVIWTMHDCWAFTGHCAYFDYVGCDRWLEKCFQCPQKNSYPSSLLLDASELNYADKKRIFADVARLTIVTPSQWLQEIVKSSFLKLYDVSHIPNGINTDVFQRKCLNKSAVHETKVIVLGVANIWDFRKGFEDFIKLSQLLDENTYQIILVGVNAAQIKSLPPSIKGIEHTESVEELANLYASAEVYVNLTYEDNFPTTNLEALACGTPVISYRTGGSVESATLCVDKGDVVGVARMIDSKQYDKVLPQNRYQVLDRSICSQLYLKQYKEITISFDQEGTFEY